MGANAFKIGGKYFRLGPVSNISFINNDALYTSYKRGKGFLLASDAPHDVGDTTASIKNFYVENSRGILDSYSSYYDSATDKGYKWSGKVRLIIDNMRVHKAWSGEDGIHIDAEKDTSKVDAIVTFNNLWVQDRYIRSVQDLKNLGYTPSISPNVTVKFNVTK